MYRVVIYWIKASKPFIDALQFDTDEICKEFQKVLKREASWGHQLKITTIEEGGFYEKV